MSYLHIFRYLRGAGFERLQKALAAQDGRRSPIAPPSPSVTSLAKYSFSVVSVAILEVKLEDRSMIADIYVLYDIRNMVIHICLCTVF